MNKLKEMGGKPTLRMAGAKKVRHTAQRCRPTIRGGSEEEE